MDSQQLVGAFPALVTPLTVERGIHDDDVEALVRRALGDGATGVLVAGSTGEGSLLEPAQRARLTTTARRATDRSPTPDVTVGEVDGLARRPTVLAGACASTVAQLHEDVTRLAEAGADAVLVLAPNTYDLSPDELSDVHLEVAEHAQIATLIYHHPQLTGSSLRPELLPSLAAHPRIAGMKDSSPDAQRRAAFIDAARADADFHVLSGHVPTLRDALRAGASGSITAIANLRLRQVVALQAAVEAQDEPTADRLQDALSRATDAMRDVGSSMPATLKAVLQLEGVITERWCRPPLRSVPPARVDHVRSALLRER